jgi:glutaredoxin
MAAPRITLLSRPGCHLCDDAREVISRVADDLGVVWEERDITQSEADLREYWEKIPVTLVDGVHHDFWRVSENRLRHALALSAGLSRASAADGTDFVHLFTNDVW